MERLTGYVSGYAHGKAGVTIKAALSNRTLNRGCFECTGMIEKLAQYEDTGLTPAEVAEYAKAKAEGRVVILSTPMIPLVLDSDPMGTDVFCPSCGETLSGGWPDYCADQEWKLCQCFHCGQSIDDTKTITRKADEAALKGGEVDA